MASVSPSASPYAVPLTSAGSPPPTSVSPPQPPPPPSELPVAPVPSQLRANPTDPPSPSSAPPPPDVSSSPLSPVLPAPLPAATSSTPPPLLVPPSLPPLPPPPPPPVPLTNPLYPLPPPPPFTTPPPTKLSSPPPPSSPVKVSPPPPFTTPPPAKLSSPPLPSKPVKVSPPPPFTTPPPTKLSSPTLPPSPVKGSPPPPPPPDNPTSSPPPSPFTSPPTHFPSTSPPTAPPAPTAKRSAPPLPASPSPPSSTHPNVYSPTPVSNSGETSSTAERNSGIGTGSAVGIGIGIGVFILSFIGLVIFCSRRRRKEASKFIKGHIIPTSISTSTASDSSVMKVPSSAPLIGSNSGSESYLPYEPLGGLGNSGLWFTYDDLEKATDGFSEENFLGEGGFGSVYKGRLHNGREVAVKQLKVGTKQGEREFRAEVDIIRRIHHRYLVSLVGYCIADNRKLLVYDFVPNNTLYFHLHGEGRPVLGWATRVKIAAGVARGLAYLHEDCHPRIIHRDIKSSNLLLDDNFAARVSDFGLAKLTLDAHTHVTTRVMGTFGYMAPEYAISGKLTEKSDVYSFGVVLLELITGRKPVDTTQPLGDEGLVEWARPLLSHALDHEEFEHLADPRLEGSYVGSEMLRMVEVAAACVRHLASKRPRMGQIVRALDSFLESDLTNGMRLEQSEVLDSVQQSLEIQAFRRTQFRSQDSSIKYFSQSMMTS